MLDSIQILLIIVISILTVLLTIIGIAVWQILKEFKKSIEKINLILDDTRVITKSVAQPVEEASAFLLGLRKGVSFFHHLSRFFKEGKQKAEQVKEVIEETVEEIEEAVGTQKQKPDQVSVKDKAKPSKKRKFFLKNGKILRKPSK